MSLKNVLDAYIFKYLILINMSQQEKSSQMRVFFLGWG